MTTEAPVITPAGMRDATRPASKIWLVDPNGFARSTPYAENIQSGHTEIRDGEVVMRPKSRREGWKLLAEVITPAELEVWLDYHAQSDRAGGRIAPLPAELWPKGIKNPREHRGESNKVPYVPGKGSEPDAPVAGVTAGAPADPSATSRRSMRGT
jgi:hypothetical protein